MARATWAFWLVDTPLNTQVNGGSGLISQLSLAGDRSMSFNLTDPDTLSFTMPLRDPRTALVKVMSTDVIAICNDRVVQRFRVKSRSRSKSGTAVNASFSAVAYKALLGSWVLHDQDTTGSGTLPRNRLDWPASYDATQRVPSAMMWTIVDDGQSMSGAHYIALSRGIHPTSGETIQTLDGTNGGTDATQHYLTPGTDRRAAIDQIAALSPGYEWSIDPDPDAPLTGLKFNVWVQGERTQFAGAGTLGRANLTLEAGASISDWSENEDPATWANVARVSGTDVSATDTAGAEATAWRPTTQLPDQLDYGDGKGLRWPVEGAVERDIGAAGTTPEAIDSIADREAAKALDYLPDYSVTLTGGRWTGVQSLWVGDTTRVVIPDAQLTDYLRVTGVELSLDNQGTETISMTFGRNTVGNYGQWRRSLELRLRSLERR